MRLLLILMMACGCSYKFDAETPDITLVGGAPNTDGLPRLNDTPAGNDFLVLGYDDQGNQDANWVAFTETVDVGNGPQSGLRAVRLSPPQKEESIAADDVTPGYTRFFLINSGAVGPSPSPTVTIRAAGQPTPPVVINLPDASGFIGSIGPGDLVFVYWVSANAAKDFFLYRSDGSFWRPVMIPPGTDPTNPQIAFQWSWGSEVLVVRDQSGDVMAHSTTDGTDVDLMQRPKLIGTYGSHLLITCGDDGLRAVQLDGSGETALDPMPCDEHGDLEVVYQQMQDWIYYGSDEQLLRVPVDGSGAPELVLKNGLRPLSFIDDGRIMFSKTPADEFVNSAGDGWLGDWRFMERGLDAGMSSDKTRVRWLEHAAQPNGAGELLSAPIGQPPLHLSLNTRQWEELADGRILADADHAFRGTQNRIVVIDEKSRTARWVAAAAADYTRIPGTQDLLIDVVTGPTGFDIVRVPIPPPEAAPDGGD